MNYGSQCRIIFVQRNDFAYKIQSGVSQNLKTLDLVDHDLKYFPKNFIITTKNGSYKFNTDILQDSSSVIASAIKDNPNITEFHIDVNDEDNVMQKFEQMYQGDSVSYDIKDLYIVRQITSALNIISCPAFMQPERLLTSSFSIQPKNTVQIDKKSLGSFLRTKIPLSFTIIANGKEYKCNKYGIYSSKLLSSLLEKDPTLNEYVYNFDDDNDFEFQIIVDFFNFDQIQITVDNMNSLSKFSEDLQITIIQNDLNEFINSYENAVQLIDDQKTISNSIDDIFSWLYHIKELTIEKVTDLIKKSIWVTTKENVKELAAFILQVVRTDIFSHSNIIELITSLDQISGENECIQILLPFILNYIKASFHTNYLYSSFAFRLYQKKLIESDEIFNENPYICLVTQERMSDADIEIDDETQIEYDFNIIVWFWPEINELPKNTRDFFYERMREFNYSHQQSHLNLGKLFKDIERYKRMREFGQPDDELTLAILNDDVDKLQSILTNRKIEINQDRVPFNLCEMFIFKNNNSSFINYAAECGSIKCFKYLLLNHAEMDLLTLGYAVYGGNTEIIRIVDQQNVETHNNSKDNFYKNFYFGRHHNDDDDKYDFSRINDICCLKNPLFPAIIKHQNDIFDWLLNQKYSSKENNGNLLADILLSSVQNGNAHVLIECIDKGLDFRSFSKKLCQQLFIYASENGFYHLLKLFFSLIEDKLQCSKCDYLSEKMIKSSASFGILSIFKLFYNLNNSEVPMTQSLLIALKRDYVDIVHFIINQNYTIVNSREFVNMFSIVIRKKSPELFNFLEKKFKIENLFYSLNLNLTDFKTILCAGCQSGNFESVKKIIDFMISIDSSYDFTVAFNYAIRNGKEDICLYLIKNNVFLDYYKIVRFSSSITKRSTKIALQIIDAVDPEMKATLKKCFTSSAIQNANKELVEFLLKNEKTSNDALFDAVESNDIDIVNIILNHNDHPSFINQISYRGTALNVAVNKSNIQIVKRLLSIHGINPNLYSVDNCTPLISAITKLNLEITNVLLDFYGDKIQSQMWQLNKALKRILRQLSGIMFDNRYNEDEDDDVNEIIDIDIDDNAQYSSFLKKNQDNILNIVNRLMDIENIDLNCHVHKYTLLTYACEANEIDLIKTLIKSDKVDVNSYAPLNGNTPLMISIENKNVEVAELLIENPRTDINLRNYNGKTALTLAVTHNLDSIVNLIVTNANFDPEQSCLNDAFYFSSGQISIQLFGVKGLDVNYCYNNFRSTKFDEIYDDYDQHNHAYLYRAESNKEEVIFNESLLVHAVKLKNIEMIEMITSHPSFDVNKSQVKSAIFFTVKNEMVDIFHKLLNLLNNDVNISQRGESLLYYSIKNDSLEITQDILENDNFDPIKSDLLKVFTSIFIGSNLLNRNNNAILDKMTLLADYDESHSHLIDFSKLLPNGKSFFTVFTHEMNVTEIVEFFLDHNADPNMPDSAGILPLQYAIMKNMNFLFHSLVNSNRIDLSVRLKGSLPVKLKNETFLHFAARFPNPDFVDYFLRGNLVDVNSIDNLGETPLMKALVSRQIQNVIRFFMCDNLDYRHCNKKGQDALNIAEEHFGNRKTRVKKLMGHQYNINNIPREKREYLDKILKICNFNLK